MSNIQFFLKSIKLPAMPEVAHALIRTLNQVDVSTKQVGDLISKDPALSATVLRMANSAYFGLSHQVSSLNTAVQLIGMSKIRTHAVAICFQNVFPMAPGLNRREFWRSSVGTATYAHWLCGVSSLDPQIGWLTGLMLRLGELMIAQQAPSMIADIEMKPCAPGERWQREKQLTGLCECEISAEIARQWDFPEEMVYAMTSAMDPLSAAPYSRLGAILHLASLLAEMPGSNIKDLDVLPLNVITKLELKPCWMKDTLPNVHDALNLAPFTD